MVGKGQKTQMQLALDVCAEGEAPSKTSQGSEPIVAEQSSESQARTESLMEAVCDQGNMRLALKRVVANKGSSGVDGMTVARLPGHLKRHWPTMRDELLKGTYRPQPVKRVEIDKPDGGKRALGIPTVVDRLVQQAILQVLQPIWDPTFSAHSYGFRPGRSAHQAVAQAQMHIQEGYGWVVDMDLERFFDRVNHDRLMARLATRIEDKRVLRVIRAFLTAGVLADGLVSPTQEGTPQGGPLSPLLSNVVLDELDRELEQRGHRFVRYADDCNIYLRSHRAGERVLASVSRFVSDKLKLRVNETKSAVGEPAERKFLGFSFTPGSNPKRRLAPKARKRFKDRVRKLTRPTAGRSIEQVVEEITSYLKGWLNYFGFCQVQKDFIELIKWLRRRLRSYLWRQWETPKNRYTELTQRGVPPKMARQAAGCRKGPWRMSASPVLQLALPNACFTALGIPTLTPRQAMP
jgi:RNA-directed DNA polymerase